MAKETEVESDGSALEEVSAVDPPVYRVGALLADAINGLLAGLIAGLVIGTGMLLRDSSNPGLLPLTNAAWWLGSPLFIYGLIYEQR